MKQCLFPPTFKTFSILHRHFLAGSRRRTGEFLHSNYSPVDIDVIVCVTLLALQFVLQPIKAVFPGVPAVCSNHCYHQVPRHGSGPVHQPFDPFIPRRFDPSPGQCGRRGDLRGEPVDRLSGVCRGSNRCAPWKRHLKRSFDREARHRVS